MDKSVLPLPPAQVYVVDDDDDMRTALSDILRSYDVPVVSFGSCADFLATIPPASPGCIVLDIRMPDVDGLEFQQQMAALGYKLPVVMMTGYGDIPMTVQAMKAGAVDFLTKPFNDTDMLQAVATALEHDRVRREKEIEKDTAVYLVRHLTRREKEVMAGVVKGLMNKQIAYELSLTEITVKLHRARLMKKMKVKTLADLVRKAVLVDDETPTPPTISPYSGGDPAHKVIQTKQ